MRLRKLHHPKRFSITFLLLSIVLVAALGVILPFPLHASASPDTTIAVDPANNVANPTESFIIEIGVADVTDLFSYEARVGFDKNVLEATDVEEGPFIKDQTTSPMGTYFSYTIADDYVYVACVTLGKYPGVGGSGNLFTVTFTVKAAGESTLHLYGTILLDSSVVEISHSTSDGDFHTTAPVAAFSFTPDTYGRPIVGETISFDASASYDPDGGSIVSYVWDFDDGTNGTDVITTHAYNVSTTLLTSYNVTLSITDDDGENNTVSLEVDVKFHDIAILEIETPDEVHTGEIARIDVTVLNNGSHHDTFNVTAFYNSIPINTEFVDGLSPGDNETLTFLWNTYINQTMLSPSIEGVGAWTYPLNASTSDDLYTYTSTNNTYQEFRGYEFDTIGWTCVSKVEVGIEVKTDVGGDDQLNMSVYNGKTWSEDIVYNITSVTDAFFWVDVTGSLLWEPSLMNKTRVRIRYIQVGVNATPIYVDWLPVRINPLQPRDITPGSYAIWANAYLVDFIKPHVFRPSEEKNTVDNTLFGDPIVATEVPVHDIAITNIEVSPTDIVVGRISTIEVEIENKGNIDDTFDVFVYANSTEPIANQTAVTLSAGATTTLSFSWFRAMNSTVEGVYNVTAYVPPVVDEANTTNNVQNLTVLIRLLPVPFFTFSPSEPNMGEVVTFDASASYAPGDPEGEIMNYIWDFGDEANATGVTATHAYSMPGTYAVKLKVVDDDGLDHTKTETVIVPKSSSTIAISTSPTTVPLGFNTTISGSISPARASVIVAIEYTRVEETAWMSLANVSTSQNGQYSFDWMPTESGIYQIKASWKGDSITLSAESPELSVNVAIQDIAILDIEVSKIKATKGELLTINVIALNKGTAIESFNVTIYYNNTRLTRALTAPLATGVNETISLTWDTRNIAAGIYTVKALAEPLPGETYSVDNSRTIGVLIQELPEAPFGIFHYTTIGMAIVIAVMAVYLVKMKKSKPV